MPGPVNEGRKLTPPRTRTPTRGHFQASSTAPRSVRMLSGFPDGRSRLVATHGVGAERLPVLDDRLPKLSAALQDRAYRDCHPLLGCTAHIEAASYVLCSTPPMETGVT
jgi:hypothetical protein